MLCKVRVCTWLRSQCCTHGGRDITYCKVQVNHRQYHTLVWLEQGLREPLYLAATRLQKKVNQWIQYGARLVQVANPPRHRR